MKAIVFEHFGNPAEVLRIKEVASPPLGPGQVRVRMTLSPINPSDLMTVRGLYGRLPALPATPGFEGVGVVEEAGSGLLKYLRGLKPGKRVAVLNAPGGNWAEQVVVSARHVVPLPDQISDEQAASFFVNPATVVVMLRRILRVPAGAWLFQTAAGSALGRMVIRLARHDGFKTINLVRRRAAVAELKALGADEVVCTTDEDVEARVKSITGGAGVGFALDAVGGATGLAAVQALGAGGMMLMYGTLSGEDLPLPPRLLMGGQKTIRGFWLSDYVKSQGAWSMLRLFRTIKSLLATEVLTTQVEASYSIRDIGQAVTAADRAGKSGKILLRLDQ